MVWAVLDCEGIQTSKEHMCIRAMYILLEDEITDKFIEFVPCLDIKEINIKYKKAFNYCKHRIHKLNYYPEIMSGPCFSASTELKRFIRHNNITMIYFKGGQMEHRLCKFIGVPSFNIERFGAPKVNSHDPRIEVQSHLRYLKQYGL